MTTRSKLFTTLTRLYYASFPRPLSLSRLSSSLHRQQNAPEDVPDATRRQLRDFISSLERFLTNGPNSSHVNHYVHRRLDDFLASVARPDVAFTQVISALLRHGYPTEAVDAYQRMQIQRELTPPPHTHAQMLAIVLALENTDTNALGTLRHVVKDPHLSEVQFMELLEIMEELGIPYDLLHQVTLDFIEARPDDYVPDKRFVKKVLYIKSRIGLADDALQFLHRPSTPSFSSAAPYATILRALSQTATSGTEAVQKTVLAMKEDQVSPDINVLNILISRELKQKSLRGAFTLYHALVGFSKTTDVSPDASTFSILFTAFFKLFNPKAHSKHLASHESRVVFPRQLFRDLLFFSERKSFSITSPLLNNALRAFLKTQDYAGAYVVLGSFRIFRAPITAQTYHIVLVSVARRALWDIKANRVPGESKWGDRFLGIDTPASFKQATDWSFDHALIAKVLGSASQSKFSLNGYLLAENFDDQPKYKNPTPRMMDGRDPVPLSLDLSVIPLQRLMRRAIAAQESQWDNNEPSVAPRLSKIVRDAKREMFPGKERPYGSDIT